MLPGALPESDVRTVPLLRLMAATNDTRLMERLFLVTRRPENHIERLVCLAEAGYYGRMFLAHLYESGEALGALDHVAHAWVTNTAASSAEAQAALTSLREAFAGEPTAGFYGFLAWMRTKAAFHYKDASFRDALKTTGRQSGHVILGRYAGASRYIVVDVLMDEVLKKAGKEMMVDYDAALGRAVELGNALERLVAHLLTHYLQERPATWREEPWETVHWPAALRKRTKQSETDEGPPAC